MSSARSDRVWVAPGPRDRSADLWILGLGHLTDECVCDLKGFYTDPEQAVKFVDRTGCNLLAISVGTQHGVARGRDLELRPDPGETRTALHDHGLDTPLVLHESSVRSLSLDGLWLLPTPGSSCPVATIIHQLSVTSFRTRVTYVETGHQ